MKKKSENEMIEGSCDMIVMKYGAACRMMQWLTTLFDNPKLFDLLEYK